MRLLALVLVLLNVAAAQSPPGNLGQRPAVSFAQARAAFANPDQAYAPFMFWFWDEPLSTPKMAEMARVMTEQGFAPGYAHARRSMVGTPSLPDAQWLAEPWFAAFSASLAEAERAKSYLGYCDEYWWPSLQANGRLVRQHPELAATSLACARLDVGAGASQALPASFFTVAARLAKPMGARRAVPRLGHWVWHPDRLDGEHTAWFAKAFEVPAGRTVVAASARASADNAYTLYLDGQAVARGDVWMTPQSVDLDGKIATGAHLLTVEARNLDGPAALNVGLTLVLDNGDTLTVATDGSWRSALTQPAGWPRPALDGPGWKPARDLGASDVAPYHLAATADEDRVAVILADTLRVIGQGEAFAWTAPAEGDWRVYSFTQYSQPGVDGGGVNYLDERLAPTFIEMALEPYARQYGARMGRSIPGDFIDNEGDYGRGLAWSATLERHFDQRLAREMRPLLPLLFDRGAKGEEVRLRYEWFEAVSDCYAETFRAITKWHEQRGMYTTAHFWEEGLQPQLNAVGDHLKMLRALTMPGQDCLGDKALHVHDFKEAVSVAEFEGHRAMSEVMGAGGWSTFHPVFLKQALNCLTAWGIGHQIPHGVFATRKMDGNPWMPDWYAENPMYPMLHHYADFARRASYLNSVGHAVPDVLLYHPVESVWANATVGLLDRNLWAMPDDDVGGRRINRINQVYAQAIDDLTAARVEFLVGDRHYLGEMAVRGQRLARGPLSFSTVVLPPLDLLPGAVAEKLLAFVRAGGQVVALGELPTASTESGAGDHRLALVLAALAKEPGFHTAAGSLRPLLARQPTWLRPQVRLSGAFQPVVAHRRIAGQDAFWLANNTDRRQTATAEFDGAHGHAELWDCETGARRPVRSEEGPSSSRLALAWEPLQGYWVVFDGDRPASAADAPVRLPDYTPIAALNGPWTVRGVAADQPQLEHPMALPADLLAGCVKPLDDWRAWGLARFSGRLDYTCTVELPPLTGPVSLDLGRVAHAARVWVNDQDLGDRLWGPYVVDVSRALRPGRNTIRVRVANLINNSYGDVRPAGLLGPVRLVRPTVNPT